MDRALKVQVERVRRRDRTLNPLQEAEIICQAFPAGTPVKRIMRNLKRSFPWVRTRLGLMEMPPEVQQFMVSGLLSQNDLFAVLRLPKTEWLTATRQIAAGDRRSIDSYAKRVRGRCRKQRAEINRMIARLFEIGIDGLPTRLLAWAAGGVSDEEIETEILHFCQNHSGLDVLEPSDGDDHSITENDSRLPTGGEPGESEAGDHPDGSDDARDVFAEGD